MPTMTMMPTAPAAPRHRAPRVGGCLAGHAEPLPGGGWRLRANEPLEAYPARLTDRLEHFARSAPDRVFAAQRDGTRAGRPWRTIGYAQMLERVQRVAEALAARDLSAERPIAIVSGNDLEHLTLALAALWVGVPYAPVSPAYSLLSQDFARLRHVLGVLRPGLVFASRIEPYARALEAACPPGAERVVGGGSGGTPFDELLAATPGAAAARAHAAVGPDTIAKFLFTSGSTRDPKGVITTHRMWCANLQQIRQCFAFLADAPPVLVDWLPWNHVFGGSHNIGIALYNGGTLYIDEGKPVPGAIGETIANLREIAPTVYFNVPKGFEEIARACAHDEALRRSLFSRVQAFMFAGAGLSQAVWDELDRLGEATIGERIPVFTGLGMTETAPSCTFALGAAHGEAVRSGDIGLPVPGVEVKLLPAGDKFEIRFRGPNVMPGYWRAPAETAAAFDDEGFYRTGDAARLRDAGDPTRGLVFDGRLGEDFKLATGTFVSVGPLRTRAVLAGHPLVQEVVVAGADRDVVGLLVFVRLDDARRLAGLPAEAPPAAVCGHAAVRGFFQRWLDGLHAEGTGSASRPARALLLEEPPSIDRGELTDKGSINQRAVLQRRAELVQRLFAVPAPPDVLCAAGAE